MSARKKCQGSEEANNHHPHMFAHLELSRKELTTTLMIIMINK
jgi:uncharacterized Zn-finger protein